MTTKRNITIAHRVRRWLFGQPGKQMPLKEPPLRVPGQALGEQCDELMLSICLKLFGVLVPIMFPLAQFLFGLLKYTLIDNAILSLVLGMVLSPFGIVSVLLMWKDIKKLRNYRLGLLCERYVGQQLDRCRKLDYSVFHDIQADGAKKPFNIDHVLIGPGGIIVINTKGRSQSKGEERIISYDGRSLTFPGGYQSTKEVQQVGYEANYIRQLLFDLLKTQQNPRCTYTKLADLPIRPFIVYPGWGIDFEKAKGADVTVLAGTALVGYIEKSPTHLKRSEYQELRNLLGQYLLEERRDLVDY